MKIFWFAAPGIFNTGYGTQSKWFVPKLIENGIDTIVASTVDTYSVFNLEGAKTLPPLAHCSYGVDSLNAHYKVFKPDFVFTLFDVFAPVFHSKVDDFIFPMVNWAVIDSAPLIPASADVFKKANAVVAMCKWGERVLSKSGFDPYYCPLSVNNEQFYPMNKEEARAEFSSEHDIDLQDKFLITMVGANTFGDTDRKNFAKLFETYTRFLQKHSNALLYVHTANLPTYGGLDLKRLQKFFKIPDDKIVFAPQYRYMCNSLPSSYMNTCYNASDVFFSPSKGEGFGLPIVEAQMAGTPVVVTDCSAMTELCKTGFTVKGRKFLKPFETFWTDIDAEEAVQALSRVYDGAFKDVTKEEIASRVAEYDVDYVTKTHLIPVLEQAHERIKEKKND